MAKRSHKSGLPPGSPVHVGVRKTDKTTISLIKYDEKSIQESWIKSVDECLGYIDKKSTTWINVDGIHDVDLVNRLGHAFKLHPLMVEDIVNTEQRPKVEHFEEYVFLVLKNLTYDKDREDISVDQLSIVLGENYVITFQEMESNLFMRLKERMRNWKPSTRKMGSDYLAYSIMDSIVDNYFVILEELGEDIETLENRILEDPEAKTVKSVYGVKSNLITLRKSVWPLREILAGLTRGDTVFIKKPTRIYLRDVYDHTVQVIDNIETFRDMVSTILDVYLSSLSNRMNEVMKVLTIIATIFIPLTFITGLYGMNFRYMPELEQPWAYPLTLFIMLCIAVGMYFYFKGKKWI